jgi:AcrR family transcriptional regulator
MTNSGARSPSPARGRGRPVGADSAETRKRIVRSARQVINERGYEAATLAEIAKRAGLSRPAMHYYFASRRQIYGCVVDDIGVLIAECVEEASQHPTLLTQLSAFIAATHRADFRDRSSMAFLITSHLESERHPELPNQGVSALRAFFTRSIRDAIRRGELSGDTEVAPVVEMLVAILWGMGFYAGFVDDPAPMRSIAKQLDHLFAHGLVPDPPEPCPSLEGAARKDTHRDTPGTVVVPP